MSLVSHSENPPPISIQQLLLCLHRKKSDRLKLLERELGYHICRLSEIKGLKSELKEPRELFAWPPAHEAGSAFLICCVSQGSRKIRACHNHVCIVLGVPKESGGVEKMSLQSIAGTKYFDMYGTT